MNQKELDLGLSGTSSSWHDGYKDSAWIFVGGLPYDLTEGDIITVFSQYGEIVNINLVRDKITGKQKGYAFICYEDQRSTTLAVDNLNSIKLLNRTLRVDHVMNYKVPEIKGDEDELTKKLKLEGCAPDVKIEKAMKKLKKKEKKDKEDKILCDNDGKDDDDNGEVKRRSLKNESKNGSESCDDDVKPKIKVEIIEPVLAHHRESKPSEYRSHDDGDKQKSSLDERHDYSKSRPPTTKGYDDLSNSPKHKRYYDGDRSGSPLQRKYETDHRNSSARHKRPRVDDDDNLRSSKYKRHEDNRSSRRERYDDDQRSSRYRKRYDDDDDGDYRSSKYRGDSRGHRSPHRSRRDR